jgi:hypothetical protein
MLRLVLNGRGGRFGRPGFPASRGAIASDVKLALVVFDFRVFGATFMRRVLSIPERWS